MPHDENAPPSEPTSIRTIARDDRGPWRADLSPIEQSSADMHHRMQQIHCRLLERATGGRLTWDGDTIIRNPDFQPRPYKTQTKKLLKQLSSKPYVQLDNSKPLLEGDIYRS